MSQAKRSRRTKAAPKTTEQGATYQVTESELIEFAAYVRRAAKHVDEASLDVEAQQSDLERVEASLDLIQTNLHETAQILQGSADAPTQVSDTELQSLNAMARARELHCAALQHGANTWTYLTVLHRMFTHLEAASLRAYMMALDAAAVALAAGPQGKAFQEVALRNMYLAQMLTGIGTDMHYVLTAMQTEAREGMEANERADEAARQAMHILVDNSTLEGITDRFVQIAQLLQSSAQATITQAKSVYEAFQKLGSLAGKIVEFSEQTAAQTPWLAKLYSEKEKESQSL